jgi:hypothetical protein
LLFWFPFTQVLTAQFLKQNNAADLSLSSNFKQSAVSGSVYHKHQFGKRKRLEIGYGLRYTGNFGSNSNFITAPAKLTSGNAGLGVIFSEILVSNLDTIIFEKHQVNSLNLAVYLGFQLSEKIGLAFNIDALGFSFGSNQTADYNTSKRTQSPNKNSKQPAKVTGFNALLTSDNDLGSLNSELLLRYKINPKFDFKVGATFVFTEYTTYENLYLDNNRFRNKSLQPMIGFSCHIN